MSRTSVLWFVFVGGGIVMLLCGFGGVKLAKSYWDFDASANTYAKALARARRLGVPATPDELKPRETLKPEENAAMAIEAFDKLAKAHPTYTKALDEAGRRIEATDYAGATQELAKAKAELEAAEHIARYPKAQFERDWSKGLDLHFPEAATLKQAVRVLLIDAKVRAWKGDRAGTLRCLKDAYRLADFAGAEPCPDVCRYAQFAMRSTCRDAAGWVAAEWLDKPEFLAELERLTAQPEPAVDLRQTLCVEAYIGTMSIDKTAKAPSDEQGNKGGDEDARSSRKPARLKDKAEALCARHLEVFCEAIEALDAAHGDMLETSRAFDRIWARLDAEHGLSYTLVRVTFAPVRSRPKTILKDEAYQRSLHGLVQVLRFKAEHGRMPSTLSEAGVSELDPFSGKPLLMATKGESVRVYSVGPDGHDDGGTLASDVGRANATYAKPGWDVGASYPPYKWGRYAPKR